MHLSCVYTNPAFFSRWSFKFEEVQESAVYGEKTNRVQSLMLVTTGTTCTGKNKDCVWKVVALRV